MKLIPGEWRYFDEKLNMPYPWYTKSCLQTLESMDLWDKTVFEYGVGDSTLWWKAKGAQVLGVDDNKEWAEKLNMMYYEGMTDYTRSIVDSGFFDIVVIDGIWRDECFYHALNHLSPNGIIIIDNYMQPSVKVDWGETNYIISDNHLKVELLKEPGHYDWQTAIVRR